MAGVDEMPCGQGAAGDVVDGDVGQQRVGDVDEHRRHAIAL